MMCSSMGILSIFSINMMLIFFIVSKIFIFMIFSFWISFRGIVSWNDSFFVVVRISSISLTSSSWDHFWVMEMIIVSVMMIMISSVDYIMFTVINHLFVKFNVATVNILLVSAIYSAFLVVNRIMNWFLMLDSIFIVILIYVWIWKITVSIQRFSLVIIFSLCSISSIHNLVTTVVNNFIISLISKIVSFSMSLVQILRLLF